MDDESKNLLRGIYQKLEQVESNTAEVRRCAGAAIFAAIVYGVYLLVKHFI